MYKKKVYRQVLLEMEVLKINISDLGQSVNITVWDGMEMEITSVLQGVGRYGNGNNARFSNSD